MTWAVIVMSALMAVTLILQVVIVWRGAPTTPGGTTTVGSPLPSRTTGPAQVGFGYVTEKDVFAFDISQATHAMNVVLTPDEFHRLVHVVQGLWQARETHRAQAMPTAGTA